MAAGAYALGLLPLPGLLGMAHAPNYSRWRGTPSPRRAQDPGRWESPGPSRQVAASQQPVGPPLSPPPPLPPQVRADPAGGVTQKTAGAPTGSTSSSRSRPTSAGGSPPPLDLHATTTHASFPEPGDAGRGQWWGTAQWTPILCFLITFVGGGGPSHCYSLAGRGALPEVCSRVVCQG